MKQTEATNKNNEKIDEENSKIYDKITNKWAEYSQEQSAESNYQPTEEFMKMRQEEFIKICREEDELLLMVESEFGHIEKMFMLPIKQLEGIDPKEYGRDEIRLIYQCKAIADKLWTGENPTYTNETIDQVIKKIDTIIENIENVQDPQYKELVDDINAASEEEVDALIETFKTEIALYQDLLYDLVEIGDDFIIEINAMLIERDDLKYDLNGFCPNTFSHSTISKLKENHPFLEEKEYRFSGHGGSIFQKKSLLGSFENETVIHDLLQRWLEYGFDELCQDVFFSLVLILNKKTVGPYAGHGDSCFENTNLIVQHQYKVFYGIPLPDKLKHLVKIT
jgi:hypothetical protein